MLHTKTISSLLANNDTLSLDRELIIGYILSKERAFILAHPEYVPTPEQNEQISTLIKRREKGEPLAYILGTKEFYGRDFIVTPATLIPRPETEMIIDLILKRDHVEVQLPRTACFIDIGTGSGNIIITLAKELAKKNVAYTFVGTDLSHDALTIAQRNAKKNAVDQSISFLAGDLLTPIIKAGNRSPISHCSSLVIIANLPYVDTSLKDKLLTNEESKGIGYEPEIALWSPENGLAHYKRLLIQTKEFFAKNDLLTEDLLNYYEIDSDQKDLLKKEILSHFPTAKINFHKDLAKKWRICEWSL